MGSVGPSEVVERLLAAWDARDFDAFGNCLAEDVEWYDPAMGDPPARGRAAVRAFAEAVTSAFPDFRYEVLGPMCIAADGSRCAIRWRISGSHLRELKPIGYAPTGRRTSFEGVDVLDLEGGIVKRIYTAFDLVPAAEQLLGMRLRPTPGSWRARVAVSVQRVLAWRARAMR